MANQEYNVEVLKKAGGILLSVAVVLLLVYFLELLSRPEPLPEELVRDYRATVVGSKEVADIFNSVAGKIGEVDDLEASGKTDEAFKLIGEARALNEKARGKISELLSQLENLAKMILKTELYKREEQLVEVVQAEVALVGEFFSYASNVDKFLDSLGVAVVSGKEEDKRVAQRNLRLVNEETRTINDLSSRFLAKVSQLEISVNN